MLEKRDFILRLLENPNLIEHDRFTDLLWAVMHVVDELEARPTLTGLPAADEAHLQLDIRRAYNALMAEWILYVEHLKTELPVSLLAGGAHAPVPGGTAARATVDAVLAAPPVPQPRLLPGGEQLDRRLHPLLIALGDPHAHLVEQFLVRLQHVAHHLRAGHVHEAQQIGLHALPHPAGGVHEPVERPAQSRPRHRGDRRHRQAAGGGAAQEQAGQRRTPPWCAAPGGGSAPWGTGRPRGISKGTTLSGSTFSPHLPPSPRRPPVDAANEMPERDRQHGDRTSTGASLPSR